MANPNSSGGSVGLHMLQNEAIMAVGSGALGGGGFPDFGIDAAGRGIASGSKQDIWSAGSSEGCCDPFSGPHKNKNKINSKGG